MNDNLLVTIQKNLYALKDFLDKNPHLFHSTPGDPAASRNTVGHEQEAWKVQLDSRFQLEYWTDVSSRQSKVRWPNFKLF